MFGQEREVFEQTKLVSPQLVAVVPTITLIVSCFVVLRLGLDESSALIVKVNVPVVVGLPEIFEPETESPAGNVPEDMDHTYGVVPPVADKDWE